MKKPFDKVYASFLHSKNLLQYKTPYFCSSNIKKDDFLKKIKVSKKNPFNSKQFWDEKYTENNKTFEWYITFEEFISKLGKYFTHKDYKILNVGAGNSEISEKLYFQGFTSITNIDYSREVVSSMLKRYSELNCKIEYLEMDMKKLVFEDNKFDVVLDLGGSDCLLCSRNPLGDYRIFIQEVYRVLMDKGLYIRISLFKDVVKYDINQYIDKNKFGLVESLTTEMKGDRIFIFDKKSQVNNLKDYNSYSFSN